jgi:hypothetical protein
MIDRPRTKKSTAKKEKKKTKNKQGPRMPVGTRCHANLSPSCYGFRSSMKQIFRWLVFLLYNVLLNLNLGRMKRLVAILVPG